MLDTTFLPGVTDPTGLAVASDQGLYVQDNYNSVDKFPVALLGDTPNVHSQSWERPVTVSGSVRGNDRKTFLTRWTYRIVQPCDFPCNATSSCSSANDYAPFWVNATSLACQGKDFSSIPNTALFVVFPRHLEDWTSRALTGRGSFVTIGVPKYVDGAWGNGQIYYPPNRDWDYDNGLNKVENLPPMTPRISYLQRKMYTRMHD